MASRTEGNFNQGWGYATFIMLLVVLCFVVAFTVNRKTHHSWNAVTVPGASAGESR